MQQPEKYNKNKAEITLQFLPVYKYTTKHSNYTTRGLVMKVCNDYKCLDATILFEADIFEYQREKKRCRWAFRIFANLHNQTACGIIRFIGQLAKLPFG